MKSIHVAVDNFIKWLGKNEITTKIDNDLLLFYLNDYDSGGFAGGAFSLFSDKDHSFVKAINSQNNDYGFHDIETYEDLCEVANELHKRGYQDIGKEPPSKSAYDDEVTRAVELENKYQWNRVKPITDEPAVTMSIRTMKITYSN